MTRLSLNCIITLVVTLASVATASELNHQRAQPYGVLVMAHGGRELWNQEIRETVLSIDGGFPVELAFGMADRATLQDAVRSLESQGVRRIAVVRLFVSGESFLEQTRYLLGLAEEPPAVLFDSSKTQGMRPVADPRAVPPIAHTSEIAILEDGLVDQAFTGGILASRALELSSAPRRETVLIIAHGMGDDDSNRRLLDAMETRAEAVRHAAPFRTVEVATLREDWDSARAEAEKNIRDTVRNGDSRGSVIVIPLRVVGFGPYAEVLEGLDYRSDGRGLLPNEAIKEWIVKTGRLIACDRGWNPSACASSRTSPMIQR